MKVILLLKQERLGLLITENRSASTDEKANRSLRVEEGARPRGTDRTRKNGYSSGITFLNLKRFYCQI